MIRKEIDGYIELEKFSGKMLHEDALALNCGRKEGFCVSAAIKEWFGNQIIFINGGVNMDCKLFDLESIQGKKTANHGREAD